MKALAVIAVAGCTPPAPRIATPVVTPIAGLVLGEASVGPITPATAGTLQGLRLALGADYTVAPHNLDNTLVFEVSRGGEHLLDVKPGDDGTIDTVAVTSVRVSVTGRPWQVGQPFANPAALSTCECDDEPDRTVCYTKGDHIAVAFKRPCDNLDGDHDRSVLAGVTIDRLVWSAKAWGDDGDVDAPPAGEDRGAP